VSAARLRVARDPALALVVRIFVGAVAERWNVPQPARDDLRLAASELFAGAVEAGVGEDVTFTLTFDGEQVRLSTATTDGLANGAGGGGRVGLIRALFPAAVVGNDVSIDVATDGPLGPRGS
jgi:hypothetical protein